MSDGVVIPWFDQPSFARAREAFSGDGELLAEVATLDEYRVVVEQQLRTVAAVRVNGISARGVTSIDMAAVDARASGDDDIDAAFEAQFDEQVLAGAVTAWPPGRNDACWCGSGAKYKRCCAALAVDHAVIAERAALLRDTLTAVSDEEESGPPPTLDDMLAELDHLAQEVADVREDQREDYLEVMRFDIIGGDYYPTLLDLARESSASTAADADVEIGRLLTHELLSADPVLADYARFVYAEALSTADRHVAALETATAAIDRLLAAGAPVSGTDRAVALIPVIDIEGPAAAEQTYRDLLEQTDVPDHAEITMVAADLFLDVEEFAAAAEWGARSLRLHLAHAEPVAQAVQDVVLMLDHVHQQGGVALDEALLDEARAWLAEHGTEDTSARAHGHSHAHGHQHGSD